MPSCEHRTGVGYRTDRTALPPGPDRLGLLEVKNYGKLVPSIRTRINQFATTTARTP
jgi:hypothetical protein